MKAEKTSRVLDVINWNGDHESIEFDYDIVLKDYILERGNIREYEEGGPEVCVYLIGESNTEYSDSIRAHVHACHDEEEAARFFEVFIATPTVFLMEFKTYSDAYQVSQYFNEGHPLQGETLIPESKLQTHEFSLAN